MSELPESVPLQIRAAGRYDRQARISWWDQSVLAASRVLVAGAGALGNEVAKNLVLLGVGSTVLVDMDTIEVSNLSRCLGFHPDDAGLHKAEVLARRLGALNPGVAVHGVVAPVQALGVGFARRATVMVGALDNREARRYLNRLAWASGTPWVDGAIGEMDGAVRIFRPPVSCYECTLDDADFADLAKRRSCRLLGENAPAEGVVPTSITTAAIVGGVQAQEAVKLIHQLAGLLPFSSQGSPNGFRFFGLSTDAYGELTPTADGCAAHDPHAGGAGADAAAVHVA